MTSFYKYGILTRAQKNKIIESERQKEASTSDINWEVARIQLKPIDNTKMVREEVLLQDCGCCGRKFEAHIPKFIKTEYQLSRWKAFVESRREYVRNYLWMMAQVKLTEDAQRDE